MSSNEKSFECGCGPDHSVRVEWDGEFRTYDLTLINAPSSWYVPFLTRLKLAWRMISSGRWFGDTVMMSVEQAKALAEFIDNPYELEGRCYYFVTKHPEGRKDLEKIDVWRRIDRSESEFYNSDGYRGHTTSSSASDDGMWKHKWWVDLDVYRKNPYIPQLNKWLVQILSAK